MSKKKKRKPISQPKAEEPKQPKETKEKTLSTLEQFDEIEEQFSADEEYQKKHKDDPYCSWEEKESLLLGRNLDTISNQTKSQVFDPRLSTIIIERMNRVMAQHATGKVRALDNPKDKLPSLVLSFILQRYIIPNADSQYDLLTKFKLQDFYSLAYGSYVSLIDQRVDKDYIGPDAWLVPIRHFFPEANSVNDMGRCFIDTWVSKKWFKSRNADTWQNIDLILKELEDKSADKDKEQQSVAEKENRVDSKVKGNAGLIHLRTRYIADQWVTYAPDVASLKDRSVCRDIANPQGNDEIPVVVKHAFPLIDRFWGLGDFERGKTLQYAINSLWNLFLDGEKMKIFPPRIIDDLGVIHSSLGYKPGATWKEIKPNSIRPWNVGSQSENAFQSTFSALLASILNQAGTTNVATADSVDPGMGKTPAAIRSMGARESSRDAWDRYQMEKTVEKSFNLMVDILVRKQEKSINFDLFEGEIKRLKSTFPDQAGQLAEIFESQTYGKMKIDKETLGGGKFKYRFDIDAGTTGKKDAQEEHFSISEIMDVLTKIPNALQEAKQTGKIILGNKVIDFGELMQRHIITSGVEDWDRIISDRVTPEGKEGQTQQETEEPMDRGTQEKLSALEQAFGQVVPEQNTNAMSMEGMQ